MILTYLLPVLIPCLVAGDPQVADKPIDDRTIAKEPAYKTKEPRYCQLAFGPQAKQSVWLVIDGEELYVDRNGNGDLTEEGERVTRKPVFQGSGFEVPKLVEDERKNAYSNLIVYWTRQKPDAMKKEFTVEVMVNVNKTYCQYATFKNTAASPKDAPVIHFGGPLEMVLLSDKAPLAAPGEEREITAVIGTKSPTGHQTMVRHDRELSPKNDAHPIANITFPGKAGGPIPAVNLLLDNRCCNVQFKATVKTPAEAVAGKAKITLSFPGWKEVNVATTTKELAVAK